MAIWSKLRVELDRAGKVAQHAIDEGKLRLELVRLRQLADRAAQALGYAVYRARAESRDIDPALSESLSSALASHEAEIKALEAKLADTRKPAGQESTPAS